MACVGSTTVSRPKLQFLASERDAKWRRARTTGYRCASKSREVRAVPANRGAGGYCILTPRLHVLLQGGVRPRHRGLQRAHPARSQQCRKLHLLGSSLLHCRSFILSRLLARAFHELTEICARSFHHEDRARGEFDQTVASLAKNPVVERRMAFEPNHKEIEAASREKGDVMPATAAATRETKAKGSATLDSFDTQRGVFSMSTFVPCTTIQARHDNKQRLFYAVLPCSKSTSPGFAALIPAW